MSSENEKAAAVRFKEHMGSFFHDMLRSAGITMIPTTANDRIRAIGERMASSIEAAATRQSIVVIRQLQTAVVEAFALMEAALKEVKHVTTVHQAAIDNLLNDQRIDSKHIKDLTERIRVLEKGMDSRCSKVYPE